MKNLPTIILILLLGLNANGQDNGNSQKRPPIIDMHLHTGLPHKVPAGAPSLCRPAPCKGDAGAAANSAENLKKTLEQMDRYNIVKGFLSGVNWPEVGEWAKAAPGRFIASPFVLKPGSVNLEQLKSEYRSGHFRGMGEIGTQLMGIPPQRSIAGTLF
ncbi:hypothetical protein K8352_12140 [Flavobacteriaceae bacterium F89]|uniref:Amidohydrolase-related domain-containing protein n=1 Tax=Cerina litoralis TaxID=2874477 RepID=A0AAE3JRL8_9FLAO|nr:hypothetical protein [Cerina litoralis]MCG2461503.1 hypothetical protein [Cerina litoralis]